MAKELIKLWHNVNGNTLIATVSKQRKMKPGTHKLIKSWIALIVGFSLIGAWLILSATHEYLFWEEAMISLGVILCLILFGVVKPNNQNDSKI